MTLSTLLMTPPVIFALFLGLGFGLSKVFSRFSAGGETSERKLESYACGQRQVEHHVIPDYSQFFPYAFFFTVMHVLILVVATAPPGAVLMPLLYVAGGVMALVIIFRR